ncbi:glutamate dehydrogenase [Flavobacterium sp. SOK18b]|uniref:THC0290_0291 family protein n=1 Tax=Flavobacterium sp. SOK18b TaxID=797900 RepID=UPI0015FC6566|nr:glutamate dehydrogenase [Flavobacterium sp. SOK18b]MBB1193736.1 glutamate dehydrogenase [Flavobacterium sp. SOK18b]
MARHIIPLLVLIFGFSNNSNAQFDGFSHEVGVVVGPIAFQSDYGERYDFSTNAGNTGIGIGLVHYLNFTYDSDFNYTSRTFFNQHFKLRTELSYNKTNLKHFGEYVDPSKNSLGAQQLRAMTGSTAVANLGMQLEFYPWNIRDFTAETGSFAPFVSLGGQFSAYNAKAESSLGPLGNAATTFPKYLTPSEGRPYGFSSEQGTVWSVVSSVGSRYKLTDSGDLMVDLRFQYFFSNWVDGLNPNPKIYKENKANDWLVWFNVGYIHYLN